MSVTMHTKLHSVVQGALSFMRVSSRWKCKEGGFAHRKSNFLFRNYVIILSNALTCLNLISKYFEIHETEVAMEVCDGIRKGFPGHSLTFHLFSQIVSVC